MPTETDTRRIALISDIHGNLPALRTVLSAIEAESVDAVWCLGDLVGYGAHPNECVEVAAEAADVSLIGNHDLVVIGRLDIDDFSPAAAVAARWTQEQLDPEARKFLESLDPERPDGPIGLYHGSPRDPVWEYVLSAMAAEECMDEMKARVAAIGHSHVALAFWDREGSATAGAQAEPGSTLDLSSGRWLINPGSVGQPRDGDPRASWMVLDVERWTATWHRTEYPIDEAADAIREAGLPAQLADRLYYGG